MNFIRGFTDLKEQRQLYYEPACQKDAKKDDKEIGQVVVITGQDPTQPNLVFVLTKAGRFLSSGSAWDRASLGSGVVGVVISGQDPTQLVYCLYFDKGRQISEFICNVKNVRIKGLGSWNADLWEEEYRCLQRTEGLDSLKLELRPVVSCLIPYRS